MPVQTSPQNNSKKIAGRRAGIQDDRPWTAVERHKLQGLIDRGLSTSTIARTLRRPLARFGDENGD